ncbi:SRPBCC family protein [Ectobacillus sp. sgz5001026]|uniref:SRPBCC family protein n=1 Tax=Ectobacillus sp. sgz5001026 TaxID=3242473 RepID=UPI0036D23E11
MKMKRWVKIVIATVVFFGVLLLALSFGHQRLSSEIEINASEDKVWAVLSDLSAYKEWNPFMQSANGELQPGQTLHMRLQNGSLTLDPFTPTLLKVEQNKEINWIGRAENIPKIFDGNHHLVIERISDEKVKFVQYEDFDGILIPIIQAFQKKMFTDTLQGYEKMNQALKERVEG